MSRLFFGGIPTEVDVKKLETAYGTPTPGAVLKHEEIERVIGHAWKTARYTSVLNQWRNRLYRSANIVSVVDAGIGVRFLHEHERVGLCRGRLKQSAKHMRRTAVVANSTDVTKIADPMIRAEAGRIVEVTNRLFMYAASEVKALQPPKPPAALPKVGAR